MKWSSLLGLLFLCCVTITSGEPNLAWSRVKDRETAELYVVVVFGVSPIPNAPKNTMRFEATVVRVFRGGKKIGEKVTFDRVYEAEPLRVNDYLGGIFALVFEKTPMNGSPNQGMLYVDAQDPEAFFRSPVEALTEPTD
jgi:hypothetical protein